VLNKETEETPIPLDWRLQHPKEEKIMKRLLLFSSSLILMVLLVTIPSYSTTIGVVPSFTSVTMGDTFAIDINVTDSVSSLYSFQFDFGFDQSVITAVSVQEGALTASWGNLLYSINNSTGTIDFIADFASGGGAGVSGSGSLVKMWFQADALGTSPLNISKGLFFNDGLDQIDVSYANGSVEVNPIPEPSTLILLSGGLMAVVAIVRRKRS
jgi:hypothetical protein